MVLHTIAAVAVATVAPEMLSTVLIRRPRGRPSLPPDERLRRLRASNRAWTERNLELVKQIQTEYQRRPETKARRAELDELRWAAYKASRAATIVQE